MSLARLPPVAVTVKRAACLGWLLGGFAASAQPLGVVSAETTSVDRGPRWTDTVGAVYDPTAGWAASVQQRARPATSPEWGAEASWALCRAADCGGLRMLVGAGARALSLPQYTVGFEGTWRPASPQGPVDEGQWRVRLRKWSDRTIGDVRFSHPLGTTRGLVLSELVQTDGQVWAGGLQLAHTLAVGRSELTGLATVGRGFAEPGFAPPGSTAVAIGGVALKWSLGAGQWGRWVVTLDRSRSALGWQSVVGVVWRHGTD